MNTTTKIVLGIAAITAFFFLTKKNPTRIEIKKKGVFPNSGSETGQSLNFEYSVYFDNTPVTTNSEFWIAYPKPAPETWNTAPVMLYDSGDNFIKISLLAYTENTKYYLRLDLLIDGEIRESKTVLAYE